MPDPVEFQFIADTEGADNNVKALNSDLKQTGATTADASEKVQQSGVSFTELRSALSLAEQGLRAVKGAYDDTVGSAITWGQTVEKLADESGTTTQKASEMAVVFGDFGVDVDNLNTMVKALTKDGLAPNLDTIEKLAAQYQAITDPVQRNQFVFETFGRTGEDLNQILSQSPEKLQALATQADATGKVLSQSRVNDLQAYSVSVHQLTDEWQGLTTELATAALPALAGAVEQEKANFQAIDILNKQVDAGHISRTQMVLELLQIEAGLADTNKFVQENITWLQGDSTASRQLRDDWDALSAADKQLADQTQQQSDNIQAANLRIMQYTEDSKAAEVADRNLAATLGDQNRKLQDQVTTQEALAGIAGDVGRNQAAYAKTLNDTNIAIAALNPSSAAYATDLATLKLNAQGAADTLHNANKEFVLQQVEAGLSGKALLDMALAFGQIDKPTYDAVTAVQAAKDTFAKTGDEIQFQSQIQGIIDKLNGVGPAADQMPAVLQPAADAFNKTLNPAIQNSISGLDDLNGKIDALHDKTVTITVKYLTQTYGPGGPGYEP